MSTLGKINPEFFKRVIYPQLGSKDKNIIQGPQSGVDYGAVKIGSKCLAFSADPFFIVPELGWEKAAWFAFHIIFSDVAVSGLKPKYLTIDLNLPPEMKESQLEKIWKTINLEAKKYKIAVITGHTGRYQGCSYPMIGGATAIALGNQKELRDPHKVKIGDSVIVTKGPGIEATGLLSVLFSDKFVKAGGKKFQKEASSLFYKMSVMPDCAIARNFKGVHAMHDATEYGIWGGLYEMAKTGNYGLVIEEEVIPIEPAVRKTAELFDFDPFSAISEGTLLAMVDKKEASRVIRALNEKGIAAQAVGRVVEKSRGLKIIKKGKQRPLKHPKTDPYWLLVKKFSK